MSKHRTYSLVIRGIINSHNSLRYTRTHNRNSHNLGPESHWSKAIVTLVAQSLLDKSHNEKLNINDKTYIWPQFLKSKFPTVSVLLTKSWTYEQYSPYMSITFLRTLTKWHNSSYCKKFQAGVSKSVCQNCNHGFWPSRAPDFEISNKNA
jgi:hypothetical protein